MQNINKKEILELYYETHLKGIDISRKLKISNSYIARIVKQDSRFEKEKVYRQVEAQKKQSNRAKEYIKKRREIERSEQDEDFLKVQHNRAASELSNRVGMNNRTLRKWCAGAYQYNSKKHGFEFDEKIGRSYAMPKLLKY